MNGFPKKIAPFFACPVACPSFLLLFIALLAPPHLAAGQTVQDEYLNEEIEVREFDEEKWEDLRQDIDYSGDEPEQKEDREDENPGDGDGSATEPPTGPAGLGEVAKYTILGGAILVAILLLVRLLAGDGKKNRKIKPVSEMELEELEENLESAELDDPIRRAIASGDFMLATRLYYLALLQGLAEKKLINWKRDKTNGEYRRELTGSPFAAVFQDLTLIFERVWYGQAKLRAGDFPQVEAKFKAAIARLGNPAAE